MKKKKGRRNVETNKLQRDKRICMCINNNINKYNTHGMNEMPLNNRIIYYSPFLSLSLSISLLLFLGYSVAFIVFAADAGAELLLLSQQ